MKSNIKKFLVLLSMLACVFSITACDNVSNSKTSSGKKMSYDEAAVKTSITSDLKGLSSNYTDEQLETMKDSTDEAVVSVVTNWLNVKDELGTFGEITSCDFDATSTTLTVNANCIYSLRKAVFTVTYNSEGKITSSSFSPEYSMVEKVERAGLNTVIALSIVFIVLILISALISSFNLIHKYQNNIQSKNQDQSNAIEAVDNTITQIIQKEENEMNDLELVAIITAAIAASEGTSSDDFVVRSIKKINKRKWQRA